MATGNFGQDILSITAVHPIRETALRHLVSKTGNTWQTIETMLTKESFACYPYDEEKFYRRVFDRQAKAN